MIGIKAQLVCSLGNDRPLRAMRSRTPRRRSLSTRCSNLESNSRQVSQSKGAAKVLEGPFRGAYGSWYIDENDLREVWIYRASWCVTAACSLIGTQAHIQHWAEVETVSYWVGLAGVGVSVSIVHMYLTEIKRAIQILWLCGLVGSFATLPIFGQPLSLLSTPVPEIVTTHPSAIWFIGPAFAALTGLTIKEGLCYGRLEAALLAVALPLTLLTHLAFGGHSSGVVQTLGAGGVSTATICLGILATRKLFQPVKDDLGDKSVFDFMKLSEDEQREVLEAMELKKQEPLGN